MELELKSELQNKLVDYMTGLEEGVSSLVDFGSEQVPILVQEILTFGLIEHGVFIGVDLLVMCIFLFIIKKIYPYLKNTVDDGDPLPVVGLAVCTLFSVFMFASAIKGILICVKIQFAPRLFMLEYIRDLVK
jgi:hypothetical protein